MESKMIKAGSKVKLVHDYFDRKEGEIGTVDKDIADGNNSFWIYFNSRDGRYKQLCVAHWDIEEVKDDVLTWTPEMAITGGWNDREFKSAFLLNPEGKVVARLRRDFHNGKTHTYRTYEPPVNIEVASNSHNNFTQRVEIYGEFKNCLEVVESIVNKKEGVSEIMKKVAVVRSGRTAGKASTKGLRKITGPYGKGFRYISIATGKIVKTPA
jgi:hypothetical protein